MTDHQVLTLLAERGAVLEGHFELSSGRHSPVYVEKARVFEDPELTVRLGRALAKRFEDVEAVISPAVGALPLGFAVALGANARFLFAEREGGRMTLRRGFALRRGERTLVVEDVVTTGGSAGEVLTLVRDAGAVPLGVAALVDRTNGRPPFEVVALARVEAVSHEPDACPMCAAGTPIEAPGSRKLTR